MSRTVSFDEREVLERAMGVFWRNGIENTPISELVEATGLKRSSLYNTFESKEGLFRACFELYVRKVVQYNFAPLMKSNASLSTIEAHFSRLLPMFEDQAPGAGCLLLNTSGSKDIEAGAVADLVEGAFADMEKGFLNALDNAKKMGEIELSVDTAELSDLLLANVISIGNLTKSQAGKKVGKAFVKDLLARLADLRLAV